MYLTTEELCEFIANLSAHFEKISLLMDCYTVFASKMSKHKNPVKDVGVTKVHGIDNPKSLENGGVAFIKEHTMIPQSFMEELQGMEKFIFKNLYAGNFSKKLYRLYEYKKD